MTSETETRARDAERGIAVNQVRLREHDLHRMAGLRPFHAADEWP
jgi:hypothetical protein